MSRIILIGALDDVIPETPLAISGFESEGEMDLKLARQTAELEHGIAERIAGIGSPRARGVRRAITDYSQALQVINNPAAVAGIGSAIGKKAKAAASAKKVKAAAKKTAKKATKTAKKTAKKATKTAKKATKTAKKVATRTGTTKRRGNFIKRAAANVVKTVKKGATAVKKGATKAVKTAVKVATAPQRLLVKGLAEVFIPKMSMLFLYLFVTNAATIATLPAKVQKKRRKAEKFAKFMTNTIGMKEAHFLKLVRNGIMRQKKQTPEQLLALYVKGSISGPGVGDVGLIDDAIKVVIEVIGQLSKLFGKKPAADEELTADDAPDPENDFTEATPKAKRKVLVHLKHKPESQKGREPATPAEEIREAQQEESAALQIEAEPENTPVEADLPEPEDIPSEDEDVLAQEAELEAAELEDGTELEESFNPAGAPTLPTTAAAATTPTPGAPAGSQNFLLPLAAGLVVGIAVS